MGILPLPPDAPDGFFWEWNQAEDAWDLKKEEPTEEEEE